MSQDFRPGEVNQLLAQYKAGELTLGELAQRFRTHRWPRTGPPPRRTYQEMAARIAAAQEQAKADPGSDAADSFDDVEAAFFRHDLAVEEYEHLRAAMVEALKAEDQ
jgi:hypothetical protein